MPKKYIEVGKASLHNNGEVVGKQPPYGGPCEVNGNTYRMSAWVRQDKDGKNYFSIAITEVIDTDVTEQQQKPPRFDTDEVPF